MSRNPAHRRNYSIVIPKQSNIFSNIPHSKHRRNPSFNIDKFPISNHTRSRSPYEWKHSIKLNTKKFLKAYINKTLHPDSE